MVYRFTALLLACWSISSVATAQTAEKAIALDPPADRAFILDRAGLLTTADAEALRAECDKLLTDTALPIQVVTIESMAQYGPAHISIETFARMLFDQWGIGQKEYAGSSWNRGILLLVSVQDRKARIELGNDWAREYDAISRQIMEDQIIPRFRQGDFAGGIVAGVKSLESMARGQPLPRKPVPVWQLALTPILIGLAIFTVVSLIRRGASGWAWLFWGAIFGLLGLILYSLSRNSGRRFGGYSGGSFSGGSFGGGFSGGGGATGSW